VAGGEGIADREELHVHSRGGRLNETILWIVVATLTIGATAVVLGIHPSGTSQNSSSSKSIDEAGAAARTKGEIEDFAAHGIHLRPSPTVNLHEPPKEVAPQGFPGAEHWRSRARRHNKATRLLSPIPHSHFTRQLRGMR
jgi:hypothetical protein